MTNDLLTTYLASTDEPCPKCAYNLRGLQGATCPECNERLRLRVTLEEPPLAWFTISLVGLSAGAGIFSLLFAMLIWEWTRSPGVIESRAVVIICIPWLFLVVALIGLIWSRRRIAKLHRQWQSAITLASWTLTTVAIIILLAFMP